MHRNSSNPFTMRVGALAGFATLAHQLGHAPDSMLRRHGLSLAMLQDTEAQVPYRSACLMLEACALEWNCPDFGLRLGQLQQLDVVGLLGLVARLPPTVGEALRTLGHYMTLGASGFEMTVREEGNHALACYAPYPAAGSTRQKMEMTLAAMRNGIAIITGNPKFTPLLVTIASVTPSNSNHTARFFGCPVHYGESESALRFPTHLLAQATAIHDPAIEPLVRVYMRNLMQRFGDDVVAKTRHLIRDLLASGQCDRDFVAQCLQLHPRTLQRRLEEQGASFSQLLDEHRHALAKELLARKSLPLAQVADLLGYADQSVFNQTFRRWTGTTPLGYQKSLQTH